MVTDVTISIQSHFLFHMGATQICSAPSHIRHTREWKEETIVTRFSKGLSNVVLPKIINKTH